MSDDAIERYEQMLLEDPQSRAFAPLAEAHRKTGRLDDAINVARAGLELNPGYSGGLVVLGRALYEKGELDNAIEVLLEALKDTPENYLGQKFLGKVLLAKGENKGALTALDAANLLSPEDEEVTRLLDEVRSKAVTPPTMDYNEYAADSAEKARLVTYEQKPTTIDGIELSPLPGGEIEETFTFSGGGTADPADLAPVDDIDGEDMTATVIEEEEIEQASDLESLDELGAEAAAFIREGESFVEESLEDLPDEALFSVEEEMDVDVEPEEIFTPSAEPPVAAAQEAAFVPVFAPAPEPEPVPEPAPAPEPFPTPVSVPAPEHQHAPQPVFEPAPVTQLAPEPEPEIRAEIPIPLDPPSGDDQFSTETLAELYAQQGLIEKAANIYRRILDQAPENEAVKLKLETLEEQTPVIVGSVQEVKPREEGQTQSPQKGGNEDPLSMLERLLENAERIKGP
ncbi:MAG: tetratricopeptide repeat protein [bacterium]|nr:tetratricopeptide repeat protein [bacterium]MDT8365902.1 tetratricopeptide repeat protein [bacterium]